MKIYLIGLPGSGKSFLGKQLADELKLPFIDLDGVIEHEAGIPIVQLFSEKGEEHFRNLEAMALREQSKTTHFVMACGGGTPCFHNNMEFINQTGLSIYINTSVDEILQRMDQQQTDGRPLLKVQNEQSLKVKLKNLQHERSSVYEQAHLQINGSGISVQNLIDRIKQR